MLLVRTEPKDIDKYRLSVGQLMWYITKLGPEVAKLERDLAIHMSHPGPEHWKAMVNLIGYLNGKRQKSSK